MAASLKQTMDDARTAMSGFAENMEALKHNFLRARLLQGPRLLQPGRASRRRRTARARLTQRRRAACRRASGSKPPCCSSRHPDDPATERLTEDGKARLDSAIGAYLDRLPTGVLMIEGYAQHGTRDEQYLRSRVRASLVRDYLIAKFSLTPQTTGVMPLGRDSAGSPNGEPWDGVALAIFEDNNAAKERGRK